MVKCFDDCLGVKSFSRLKKFCLALQETPKRPRPESEEEEASQEEEVEPPAKKPALEEKIVEPIREEPRTVGRPRKQEEHGVLRICLKHIHKMLQK